MSKGLSGKKLLFIGGGPEQVNTIQWAAEEGIRPYVVDIRQEALGFACAQATMTCDVRDKEKILEFAEQNSVDGVVSICLESAMHTTAYIVDQLKLCGLGAEVTKNVTNKYRMRRLFEKGGLPVPFYRLILPELLDDERFPGFGGPWVVKPVDNAGSRGVRLVEHRDDLKLAYVDALKFSCRREVLIEEFIPGREISVEGYVVDGRLFVETLSDKNRSPLPYLFDIDLTFPSRYSRDVQSEAICQMEMAIGLLGVDNGPVHGELMVTGENKVFIVEIAGRGPGSKVYTEIIPYVSGIHPARLQVLAALNCLPGCIERNAPLKGATLYFFTVQARKRIKGMKGLEEVNRLPGVFECRMYCQVGDVVEKCVSGAQRFGQLITFADTLEEAIECQKKALRTIDIEFEDVPELMGSPRG